MWNANLTEFKNVGRFRDLSLTKEIFVKVRTTKEEHIHQEKEPERRGGWSEAIFQKSQSGRLWCYPKSGAGSMTTMTQLRSMCSNVVVQLREPADEHSVLYHLAGRLIQITLALYLLPAFLILLVVAGVGMLALRIGRILADLVGNSLLKTSSRDSGFFRQPTKTWSARSALWGAAQTSNTIAMRGRCSSNQH